MNGKEFNQIKPDLILPLSTEVCFNVFKLRKLINYFIYFQDFSFFNPIFVHFTYRYKRRFYLSHKDMEY